MGLGIEFRVRLKSKAAIAPFIALAATEAKSRKWKTRRRIKASLSIAFSPHAKSEDVIFDFNQGSNTEGYVKTSFAPMDVHIAIDEFLDALKPLCSSLKIDDETGYAKERDRKALKAAFAGFDEAFEEAFVKPVTVDGEPAKPTEFFTGLTMNSDGSFEVSDHLRKHMPAIELKKLLTKIKRSQ
jgi:hypothetical protein